MMTGLRPIVTGTVILLSIAVEPLPTKSNDALK